MVSVLFGHNVLPLSLLHLIISSSKQDARIQTSASVMVKTLLEKTSAEGEKDGADSSELI